MVPIKNKRERKPKRKQKTKQRSKPLTWCYTGETLVPLLPMIFPFCCSQGTWLQPPPAILTYLYFILASILSSWQGKAYSRYLQALEPGAGGCGLCWSLHVSFLEILLDLAQIPALSQEQRAFLFFLFPSAAAVGFHHFLQVMLFYCFLLQLNAFVFQQRGWWIWAASP